MNLREVCPHGRWEDHDVSSPWGEPDGSYEVCPGGRLLPADILVIEKVEGEWNLTHREALAWKLFQDEGGASPDIWAKWRERKLAQAARHLDFMAEVQLSAIAVASRSDKETK
jgi:hypothetical protein